MIKTLSSLLRDSIYSGCQSLLHSSPIVGFWVHLIGTESSSPTTQILQPIHSRISSIFPSSIFFGKKGSAIEGRAAPIISMIPRRIIDTIVSGEVKRPTPTTGLVVNDFTNLIYCS